METKVILLVLSCGGSFQQLLEHQITRSENTFSLIVFSILLVKQNIFLPILSTDFPIKCVTKTLEMG